MSLAYVYLTAANRERMAARDLDKLSIPSSVPIDRSGKRAKVTMPGYVFPQAALLRAYSKHVRHVGEAGYLGVVPIEELKRLDIPKPSKRPQEKQPFSIGQSVFCGEFPGTVATTDGSICIVAVTLLGKQHLWPVHYSKLRPG